MLIQYESDHGDINGQKCYNERKTYLPLYRRHRGRHGHDHMVVGFTTTYAAGQWFSQGSPVSSTNKTDRHDITEILWHKTP